MDQCHCLCADSNGIGFDSELQNGSDSNYIGSDSNVNVCAQTPMTLDQTEKPLPLPATPQAATLNGIRAAVRIHLIQQTLVQQQRVAACLNLISAHEQHIERLRRLDIAVSTASDDTLRKWTTPSNSTDLSMGYGPSLTGGELQSSHFRFNPLH